jgi:hypothetical protein
MSMTKASKGNLEAEEIATLNTWEEVKSNFTLEQVLRALRAAAKNKLYHKAYSLKRQDDLDRAKEILAEAERRGIKLG